MVQLVCLQSALALLFVYSVLSYFLNIHVDTKPINWFSGSAFAFFQCQDVPCGYSEPCPGAQIAKWHFWATLSDLLWHNRTVGSFILTIHCGDGWPLSTAQSAVSYVICAFLLEKLTSVLVLGAGPYTKHQPALHLFHWCVESVSRSTDVSAVKVSD